MMDEEERKRMITEGRGEFMPTDSGDWAWWPSGERGYITACELRWLADELDRRNES